MTAFLPGLSSFGPVDQRRLGIKTITPWKWIIRLEKQQPIWVRDQTGSERTQ